MRMLLRESWRHYRRRYLATGLAILLGVGFCAALLTLATATRRGAEAAASSGPGGPSVHAVSGQGTDAVTVLTGGVDVLGGFLAGFAVVALMVAGLVISNTFRIVMAQRSRDLALLRCVGAHRWQVFGGTLGEGLLLGALASALGTAAGTAFGLIGVEIVNLTPSQVELTASLPSPLALLLPFVAGVATTTVAVLPPALANVSRPPLAAMARSDVSERSLSMAGRVLNLATATVFGVAGAALLAVAATTGRLSFGLAGGLLTYLAVLAASPVMVPALIGLTGSGMRRLPRRLRGGVPATVAVLDAVRSPRRTAGAVAALTVGVTLISMLCVGAASVNETEARAVDRVAPVDVVLSGEPIAAGLVTKLRQVAEVTDVVVLRGLSVGTVAGRVEVAALSGSAADLVVRDASLRTEIANPATVIVPVSARSELPGDGSARFALRGPSGSVWVTPVFSSLQSGPLLVAPAVLYALGVGRRPEAAYLRLSDTAEPGGTLAAIRRVTGPDSGLSVVGGYAERSTYRSLVTTMLVTALAMLGVAVVISLVGVGNTLSLSIKERTREYGLLRSLGLTTRQLRLLLLCQSLLMASAAVVIGTALGICYGWIGTVTLLHGALHHAPTLVVPLGQLAVVGGVALLAGALASVLPARTAVRLSPVEGLADE